MTRVEKFAKYREEIKNMKPEDFPKDSHPGYVSKHAAVKSESQSKLVEEVK